MAGHREWSDWEIPRGTGKHHQTRLAAVSAPTPTPQDFLIPRDSSVLGSTLPMQAFYFLTYLRLLFCVTVVVNLRPSPELA